jgi:hypothetical protein
MRRFGGLSVPKNADGSPMSPEDAAQLQYGTPAVNEPLSPFIARPKGEQAAGAVDEALQQAVPLGNLVNKYLKSP